MADADIYSLFMGDEPTAQEQAMALAQALRRKQQAAAGARGLSMVASLGQNPLLQGIQQTAMRAGDSAGMEAQQGQRMLAGAGEMRAGQRLQQLLQERSQAFNAGEAEKDRALRAREGALNRSADRARQPSPLTVIVGADGQQYFVDPRNPRAPAQPIVDQQGNPLAKPTRNGPDALQVPGFTRPDGAPDIKVEEAVKMRDATAARGTMQKLAGDLLSAKDKTGREFSIPFLGIGQGPDHAAQAGPYAGMVLGLKEMAATGALDAQSERIAQGMIPTPEDSAATAREKIKALNSFLDARIGSKAQSLGYQAQSEQQAAQTLSADDQAALDWAKANLQDPRAAEILKMHGGGQ